MSETAPEPIVLLPDAVDPHALWTAARRDDPIHVERLGEMTSVVVARYAEVEEVLRDADRFSSSINQATMGPYMGDLLLAKDGHAHTQHRNLVSHAFRASALERWQEELIRPEIAKLLDSIEPHGRADLVASVTSQYPVRVILGILGIPLDHHERFQVWAEDVASGPTRPAEALASSRAMRSYLEPLVEARKREPRNDLISDIVNAEVDGKRLDEEAIYGFLRLLMPAGAETTYRLMGNLIFALLANPPALERVREDRSLIPRAIEETLRWETSITMVHRVATRDTTIGGVAVPAGASVLALVSSANRDESRHADADVWDLDREPGPHLAFGWGRHLCLGMHLARLELRIGLGAVLDRLPGLRTDPDAPAAAIEGVAFRSPNRLPVIWDVSS